MTVASRRLFLLTAACLPAFAEIPASLPFAELRKRAQQGNLEAQLVMVKRYEESRDYNAALEWLKLAGQQGDVVSQRKLGEYYLRGTAGQADAGVAVAWLRRAAEQGDTESQVNLGNCYDAGRGVAQNSGEAARWFRKAAEQREPMACFALGRMYAQGRGVRRDAMAAWVWYQLAIANATAVKGAGAQRDQRFVDLVMAGLAEVSKTLQAAQVGEARRMFQAGKFPAE